MDDIKKRIHEFMLIAKTLERKVGRMETRSYKILSPNKEA